MHLMDVTQSKPTERLPIDWWAGPEARVDLAQALTSVNASRDARNDRDACDSLVRAVNKLFMMRAAVARAGAPPARPTDSSALRKMIMGLEDVDLFLSSSSVTKLVAFRPVILDHGVLSDYLLADVPPEAEERAEIPHEKLVEAHAEWEDRPNSTTRREVVFALARMLWMVRSNLAHGDKSRGGPDRARAARNAEVAGRAAAVFADLIDAVLCSPSHRLAVYGTLAPGEVNHFVIEPAGGIWRDVSLEGEMGEWAGYPMFEWVTPGETIAASLVESDTLPSFWSRLDEFETKRYSRHLVPFTSTAGKGVTNCYVRAADRRA